MSSTRSDLDDVRDLVEGRLASGEAQRVRALIAARPDLEEFAEHYERAHGWTAPHADATRLLSRRATRRASLAAAAGVLAAALVLTLLAVNVTRTSSPLVVELSAMPLEPASTETELEPLPRLEFEPVEGGRLRWLDDYPEAATLASVSRRPVLLFVQHPECPVCRRMRSETLVDSEVVDMVAESFVPVTLDIRDAIEAVPGGAPGFPWFAVLDGEGRRLHAAGGYMSSERFRAEMRAGLEGSGSDPLPWSRVQALGRRLASARQSELEGRLAAAFREYGALQAEDAQGPLARASRAGQRRIGQRAYSALVEARTVATGDPRRASSVLRRAEGELEGTPLAADLRAVREALERTGRFPALRRKTG